MAFERIGYDTDTRACFVVVVTFAMLFPPLVFRIILLPIAAPLLCFFFFLSSAQLFSGYVKKMATSGQARAI